MEEGRKRKKAVKYKEEEREVKKGGREACREEGREGMCSVVILGSWDRGVLNIVFTLIYILKQNRDYRSIYGGGKYRSRARSCLWEGGREGRRGTEREQRPREASKNKA